ncbi:MAG: MATE family efflux transporter [Simkaniaceae bacterium]|nr:MATE family efflux transporter [Simkaniaceae bacterium]
MDKIGSSSLRDLWRISFSLMISFFSMLAMVFVDRLFLARYSPEALKAAASAGTLFWSVQLGFTTLAVMAEVFVAQYNGAKQYSKLGAVTWQMIWLSVFSIFFFLPFAFIGGNFLFHSNLFNLTELTFFRWNVCFAPLFTFLAALSSFFIGQGKTKIIKWLAILGNLVNIILDPIFIFGIKGWVPSYGIAGAATATAIGVFIQVLILGWIFLKPQNKILFGTNIFRLQFPLFSKIIKTGLPTAIFVTFEILAWAIFYWMMAKISDTHILVASICQSILFLFLFFGLGLEKGIAAISGNLIGAGKVDEIKKVLKSGFILVTLFTLFIATFLIIYPEPLIHFFFSHTESLNSPGAASSALDYAEVKSLVKMGLVMMTVYITFENLRWLFSGILTSAGDTFFLLINGTITIWFFMLLPTYYFVVKPGSSIKVAFYIWILYSVVAALINALRYFQGRWKEKNLIEILPQDSLEITTD